MAESTFIYVTYIRTTPEKLWQALTDPAFIREYWCGIRAESDWTPGSPWQLVIPDGRVADSGEVIDAEPGRRLVIRWRNEFRPELREEGFSRCIFVLQPVGTSVKLTVTHEMERSDSKFVQAVSNGWPHILSSLKSLLETGESLEETRHWPKGK
jgi:uncharacterized protein YndB with AHSA1/START domain